MSYRPTEATRRTAEIRRAAMLIAARGIVARADFASATVAAIAAEAGCSVGSVYSYFDNREALLAEVFRDSAEYEFAQVATAVHGAGDEQSARLEALIDTFADRALRGRRMAWSLLFEPVTQAVERERLRLRRSYRELGEDIIRGGIADGSFLSQDVPIAAAAVMGAISEALVGPLNPDTAPLAGDDPALLLSAIRGFCFRALGAPGESDVIHQSSIPQKVTR